MRTDASPETKVCKGNHSDPKPISEFGPHPTTRDRLKPYCKACETERVREWRNKRMAEDPVAFRAARQIVVRKNRYGITHDEYLSLLEAQDGGCAICGSTSPRNSQKDSLAVDHDHKTGKVRGLLCDPCNNGLARFEDEPERLVAAAAYLMKEGESN